MNQTEHSRLPLLVVFFLGVTGLCLSLGVLILTFYDKKIDGGLFTLAGTVMGALGSLLVNPRTQSQRQSDAPVPVTTLPGQPVETTEAPESKDEKPPAYAPGMPDEKEPNE